MKKRLPFFAAAGGGWIDNVAAGSIAVLEKAVLVLAALGMFFFVWGAVVFIYHADNQQKRTEGRNRMLWGVVGLFVLISTWGIVQLLQGMFDIGAGLPQRASRVQVTY